MENLIALNELQFNFLLRYIKNEKLSNILSRCIEKEKIYENKYPTNRYSIKLSDLEKEKLLDELTILLTEIGFDKANINKEGLIMENLIDLFQN